MDQQILARPAVAPANAKPFIWLVAGVILGALAADNPFYAPHITPAICVAAWAVATALALIFSAHPLTARIGVLLGGLFMAVPYFLWDRPLPRGILVCLMGLPLAIATASLLAPPATSFPARMAWLCSWCGMRRLLLRPRRFDTLALVHFALATSVFVGAIAAVKSIPAAGLWFVARWFAGGVMLLAFAEMATASHNFITGLLGLVAPALLNSPAFSKSINEFWTQRWNPMASVVVFRQCFFRPLAHRGMGFAMFVAFFASAVGHVLVAFVATGQWRISLLCGAFFLVQPIFVAAERRLNVKHWRPVAAHAWTLSVLAVTSPLFVEPALQVFEPSWGPPGGVLLPTAVVVIFMVVVDASYALASLAVCSGKLEPKFNAASSPSPRG